LPCVPPRAPVPVPRPEALRVRSPQARILALRSAVSCSSTKVLTSARPRSCVANSANSTRSEPSPLVPDSSSLSLPPQRAACSKSSRRLPQAASSSASRASRSAPRKPRRAAAAASASFFSCERAEARRWLWWRRSCGRCLGLRRSCARLRGGVSHALPRLRGAASLRLEGGDAAGGGATRLRCCGGSGGGGAARLRCCSSSVGGACPPR